MSLEEYIYDQIEKSRDEDSCHSCGCELEEWFKYCPMCGEKLPPFPDTSPTPQE